VVNQENVGVQAPKVPQVLRVLKGYRGYQVLRGLKVLQVPQEWVVNQETVGLLVLKVHLDVQDHRVSRGVQASKDHQVLYLMISHYM
jgi:hypothetical protein